MYQHLHVYIDLCWEAFVDDLDSYLKKLHNIVQFVHVHNASLYYSENLLNRFVGQCEGLDDDFISSKANVLDLILAGAIKIREDVSVFEVEFAFTETYLKYRDDIVMFSEGLKNKKAFISLKKPVEKISLLSVKSNGEFEKIEIDVLTSVDDINNWISQNGEQRNFNLSPKHGENGRGNWKGESVLYVSQADAQILLDGAIGDFTKKNRLFNYDATNNLFIEFFYEGPNPQTQWHGFHITEGEVRNRVPEILYRYYKAKYFF